MFETTFQSVLSTITNIIIIVFVDGRVITRAESIYFHTASVVLYLYIIHFKILIPVFRLNDFLSTAPAASLLPDRSAGHNCCPPERLNCKQRRRDSVGVDIFPIATKSINYIRNWIATCTFGRTRLCTCR